MKRSNSAKLIFPALALALALIMLISSSLAWLSMNKNLDTDGMKINADVSANLVIAATSAAIPTAFSSANPFSVTFTDAAATLKACTYDSSSTYASSYLKALSNPWEISKSTGLQNAGASALTYETTTEGTHYIKKEVYIASHDAAMTAQDVYVVIDSVKIGSPGTEQFSNVNNKTGARTSLLDSVASSASGYTYKAVSIDFYLDSGSGDTYVGTLNVAGHTSAWADQKALTLASNASVPKDDSTPWKVTMFVYYDGALTDDDNHTQAYVFTDNLTTADIELGVHFFAENHTT